MVFILNELSQLPGRSNLKLPFFNIALPRSQLSNIIEFRLLSPVNGIGWLECSAFLKTSLMHLLRVIDQVNSVTNSHICARQFPVLLGVSAISGARS